MEAERKSRLGRGLDALIGTKDSSGSQTHSANSQATVPLDAIDKNPLQPRHAFDDEELKSLSESIRNHGVLQPLLVRSVGDRYQLIAGERRFRAAQVIGLTAVPVTVVDFNDQQTLEAALVENIQRTDLNPIEKAQGFHDYLQRYQMTHDQLATRLGLARSTITNLVSLLDLPEKIQNDVRNGQLTLGHAKILKGITDPEKQQMVAREIVARGLSVHATEAFLKTAATVEETHEKESASSTGKSPVEKTAHVVGIEDELRQKFGIKVEIKVKAKERGQVILSFDNNDDFDRLVESLRKSA